MGKLHRGMLLCLTLLAGAAQARDCELSISQARVDYGLLNRTTLKATGTEIALVPRSLGLTLHCTQPGEMRLAYRAMAAGAQAFRFGDQGRYELWFSDALLDDVPINLGRVALGGAGIQASAAQIPLWPEHELLAMRGGLAVGGQRLTAQVQVRSVGSAAALRAPQASEWSASGLFEGNGRQRDFALRAGFTPASCTPTLGQGNSVDFGRIAAQHLALDNVTVLKRSITLTVRCDGQTRFAIAAQDNRAGSALPDPQYASAGLFGIGLNEARAAFGGFRLRVANPMGDTGTALSPLYGTIDGVSWLPAPADDAVLEPSGRLLGFVGQGAQTGVAVAGPSALSDFTAQLWVDLYLAPLRALNLKQALPIEGSATLEIVYL